MISRYDYGTGIWIDLENPNEKEVREIAEEFPINERIALELYSETPNSVVSSDDITTFIVSHFPAKGENNGEIKKQEIDIVVGNSFIITTHYEVSPALLRLRKLLETQKIISPKETVTGGVLLEIIFAHLYSSVRDLIMNASSRLSTIENDMFGGKEKITVRSISDISREFLHIEAMLANQESTLERFFKMLENKKEFDGAFLDRAERIRTERNHIARLAMTYRAVAIELRETNASLLNVRQNEIVKTLTVVTFITLPLELITFIFGMHALGAPLEENPYAFWIILSLMILVGIIMATIVKSKKWLY